MNEVKIFENAELGLKVRTILNPDGSISVSAEDTAIGFGWYRTEVKNGKEYTSVMWSRMNGYCKELGFAHECAKEDYIPESLYYLLGMKANNEKAQKYQRWLAMDVLPALRKTGSYEMTKHPENPMELLELHYEAIKYVDKKVDNVEQRVDKLEYDIPLYGCESDELAAHVKRKGVQIMGGKKSGAYKDSGIRSKVYRDIYDQIKREFGIYDDAGHYRSYKALKRKYIYDSHEFIDRYEPPTYLAELISDANAQMKMDIDSR